MNPSTKYFLITVLLIFACSCVKGQFSINTCIRDPQKILDAELNVTDTTVDRFYFLCPNTNFYVKPYDWTSKVYSNGNGLVRPLIFIYPNAHIICGSDGNSTNNCAMRGGTMQLEVVDANYYDLPTQKITNISVRGVTFTNLGAYGLIPDSANIYIFGASLGTNLLVQDCVFQNNRAIANIKFDDNFYSSVSVVGSVFKNNTLVSSTVSRNSGIIFTDLGGTIVVNKSLFMDNIVNTTDADATWDGLHAVINANDISGQTPVLSNINVADSCFVRNKGLSFSLVLGAIWGDGVLNSRNNYANGNTFLYQNYSDCGIGQLYMNIYYNYFGYYNLSTGLCQRKFTASSCSSFSSEILAIKTTNTTTASSPTTKATGNHVNVPAAVLVTLLFVATGVGYFLWRRRRSLKRQRTPVRL